MSETAILRLYPVAGGAPTMFETEILTGLKTKVILLLENPLERVQVAMGNDPPFADCYIKPEGKIRIQFTGFMGKVMIDEKPIHLVTFEKLLKDLGYVDPRNFWNQYYHATRETGGKFVGNIHTLFDVVKI